MHFEYELVAVGHADEERDRIEEVREVYGDWDEIYVPTKLVGNRRQVLIRKLAPGEAVHVSFTNLTRSAAVIRELRFASVPSEELDGGSPLDGVELPAVDDGSACACTSAGPGGTRGAPALGLLLLAAIGRRRSRRR
ncbi:MAG: MYXO-CTERM sorting domain-containing protein [Enhygromyxa sp.]